MHLWNDYEGKTIAGAYPLGSLLRTEGRSASFSTRATGGRPAIIRLTETLNDEQEMRARYRAIQAAAHPNLVEIEDFGETEFEGTPLLYVVTEATEESLAEILAIRRLSVEETGEVALSMLGGLETLHAHGLVHGLVGPASVLAVGEVIKLRTDCVRPAPEGGDGARTRYEDVFGLADVLNRSLTQQHLVDASDALALPEPYASVVRNVVRGTWGLEQVGGELRRYVRSAAIPPTAPTLPAAPGPRAPGPVMSRPPAMAAVQAGAGSVSVASSDEAPTFAETLAAAGRVLERADAASHGAVHATPALGAAPSSERAPRRGSPAADPQLPLLYAEAAQEDVATNDPEQAIAAAERKRRTMWVAGGAAVLLVLLLLLWFGSSGSKPKAGPAGAANLTSAPATLPPTASASKPTPAVAEFPHATGAPAAAPKPFAAAQADAAPAPGNKIWRVVAYTYNREDQAEAKARSVAERHADLQPQVFSRTGHAPYLVTLGGPLSRQAAAAMRQRARGAGLAQDVYMQNYSH